MEGQHMNRNLSDAAEALSKLSIVVVLYSQKGTARQADAAMKLASAVMSATQAVSELLDSEQGRAK
jgi:hypothetical protein